MTGSAALAFADSVTGFAVEWQGDGASEILAALFGLLLASGAGVPIPEDLTLLTGGYLASRGAIPLAGAIAVGVAGVWLGDATLYSIGRTVGTRIVRSRWGRRWLPDDRVDRLRRTFAPGPPSPGSRARPGRRLFSILLVARAIPMGRGSVYFIAGTCRVPAAAFVIADLVAVLTVVPIVVSLAYLAGPAIDRLLAFRWALPIGVVIAVVLAGLWIAARARRGPRPHGMESEPESDGFIRSEVE